MVSKIQILLVTALSLTALTASAKGFPGSGPVMDTDFYDNGAPPIAKVQLGKLLYFDKILSGNMNISCASCHHTMAWTGDGLSLPVGEGGQGLGVTRDTGPGDAAIHERVPRHAPPVFNLGAREFSRMFYDGRVEENPAAPSGFNSPAGDDLPPGLGEAAEVAISAFFIVAATVADGEGFLSVDLLAGVEQVLQLVAEGVLLFEGNDRFRPLKDR